MAWLRRLLSVTRSDRIRDETVRSMFQQNEALVQKMRKRRLTWFSHVTKMEGERLPLRALHCHVAGERNQGRQSKCRFWFNFSLPSELLEKRIAKFQKRYEGIGHIIRYFGKNFRNSHSTCQV